LETPDFARRGSDLHFVMDSTAKTARIMNIGTSEIKYWVAEKSDPGLYIVPDEGPTTIHGNSSERMMLLLLANASAGQYSFHLKTNMNDDKRVVVDVPNLELLRRQSAERSSEVLGGLNQHLALAQERSFPSGEDPKSLDSLALAAYKVVEKELPALPSAAKWVVVADALSAVSLNSIAAEALRKAEAISVKAVQSPSAQDVAMRVQLKTPEKKIFLITPIHKYPGKQSDAGSSTKIQAPGAVVNSLVMPIIVKNSASSSRTSLELAERMKKIPNLASSGFSLEGEVNFANGKTQEANEAFRKANAIERGVAP